MRAMSSISVCTVIQLAVATLVVVALGISLCPSSARAEVYVDSAKGTQRVVYNPYDKAGGANREYIFSKTSDLSLEEGLADLKSSNEKVITAESVYYATGSEIVLTLKKSGKSTITYTYDGVKHVVDYIVKKYANPVSKFKVGTKNYASTFKKKSTYTASAGLLQGKLNVKAAKNWKLKKVDIAKPGSNRFTKSKNGANVKAENVRLTLKNTKTKIVQQISLRADIDND